MVEQEPDPAGATGTYVQEPVLRSHMVRDIVPHHVRDLIENDRYGDAYDWWETRGAAVLVEMAKLPRLIGTLAAFVELLSEGADPMWVIGGTTVDEAIAVALEWLAAGIDPADVGPWLRAGCWSAEAARRLMRVGIRPNRLLDARGEPGVHVDVGPDGPMPLAQAVADNYLTGEQAGRYLFVRAGRRGQVFVE